MKQKWAVGLVLILVSLVVGAGLERVRVALVEREAPPEPAPVVAPEPETPRKEIADVALRHSHDALRQANEALRRRVAELEQAQMARQQAPPPQLEAAVEEQRQREERSPRRGGGGFAERLEQLRQENPDEYAEMQRRREEFRQTMAQRAQDRVSFLEAIDKSNMDEAQREAHQRLMTVQTRLNELMAQVAQSEGERNPDARREIGELMTELSELYAGQRRFLFEETARAVGYTGAQTEEFANHMQTIIDNTSMMPGFMRRGGRGGGPPPEGAR